MTENNLNKNNIIYIYDQNLCSVCNRLPRVYNRGSVIQDLLNSYGLMNNVTVKPSIPASEDDLKLCHSSYYIDFVKRVSENDDIEKYENEAEHYGLDYDCPILEDMFHVLKTIAGGSLTAANYLINGECRIAINWFGGWHHAQRDTAEGFCYVNDIAIAIQKLSEKFRRVLYIDFDIHHGNGVQNLFETSQRVLTLSFHKYMLGFYPGTGSLQDLGYLKGKYFALNVPLLEGVGNNSLLFVFSCIFPRVTEAFKPDAVVIQCGADGINGDPVGQSNLTPESIGTCVKSILNLNIPTLVVGGGGYNFANTARLWTYLTSIIVGKELSNDIPETSQFWMEYKPDYELQILPGRRKDTNTEEYLQNVVSKILEYCNNISVT